MRPVKLYIASSIDGKIAGPNGELDWLPDPMEDDYGYQELLDSIDTTLMGFKTYEICANFGKWPYPGKNNFVFSHHPDRKLVPEASLILEDPVKFVQQLKQTEGKAIWLIGGGEIISILHNAGLIDEYILAFIPVILGAGIALFPEVEIKKVLKLQKHKIYENGLSLLYYRKTEKPE